jgi:predicted neuraminidase
MTLLGYNCTNCGMQSPSYPRTTIFHTRQGYSLHIDLPSANGHPAEVLLGKVILDLRSMLLHGELYRSPEDANRIEAFIPAMGPENHASNLAELPNGDFLCCWFAGSSEGAGDVGIVMARLPAGSVRWTQPLFVSEDRTRSEQNPLLFVAPDNRLWLMYSAQETRGCTPSVWEQRKAAGEAEGPYTMQWTAVIRRRVSVDFGRTWGSVEDYFTRPGSFCRQRMLVLSNGNWLFPMYYSVLSAGHGEDFSVMQISPDQGRTWHEVTVPNSRGRVQPSVIEIAPGDLLAFFRSRAADRIYISRSKDYGHSWSSPERTLLPNNNASIQAIKLQSGRIALVFNNFNANDDPTRTVWPSRRYPLTIALSEDGGMSWPYLRDIDPGDGMSGEANRSLNRACSYPCILQTRDEYLHICYSYRSRQCIKYVRVREDWVMGLVDRVWR